MGGSEQVLTDAAALASRTQATVTYQIATALQTSIGSLLDPAYTLVGVVLLCMYTEFAAQVLRVDVSIARRVLLAQLGLSLMGAVDYALVQAAATRNASFLLRTYSLCLPSVLGSVSPAMLSNDYVQNAISSYVYRYAQNSQEMLQGVDFGALPLYVCVLSVVMARHSALARIQQSSIFTYVFQGWRLLLVDVLTRSIWDSSLGAPKFARVALSLGLVLAVDVLGLARWGMLQDVRGYAVFRTAQQLNSMQLLSLDEAGSCAVALVLLCTRSAVAHLHSSMNHALSTAAHTVSDIVCVASINALLNNMISSEDFSSPVMQFLLVSIVAVMACTIQQLLSDASQVVQQRS
jgi:hypothetical protein